MSSKRGTISRSIELIDMITEVLKRKRSFLSGKTYSTLLQKLDYLAYDDYGKVRRANKRLEEFLELVNALSKEKKTLAEVKSDKKIEKAFKKLLRLKEIEEETKRIEEEKMRVEEEKRRVEEARRRVEEERKRLDEIKTPIEMVIEREEAKKDSDIKPINSDTIEIFDKFRFINHYRVITNTNNIYDFYNKVLDYYEQIEEMGYSLAIVNVFFVKREENDNRVITRSIDFGKYFGSVEILEEWYNDLKNSPEGIRQGSEGVDTNEYSPIFDKFDLIITRMKGDGGKFKYSFFNYIEQGEFKDNLCGLRCLHKIGQSYITEKMYYEGKLYLVDEMKKWLSIESKDTSIITNYIKYEGKIERKNMKKFKTINNRDIMLNEIKMKDIKINYISKGNGKWTIIYDIEAEHYEVTDKLELSENLYCTLSKTLYYVKGGIAYEIAGNIANRKNLEKNNFIKPSLYGVEYLFIDYETVTDWKEKGVNKPYSVALLRANYRDLSELNQIENTKYEPGLKSFIRSKGKLFTGYDCSEQLIKYVEKIQQDKIFYFITFNGANFDNYILYNACVKYGMEYLKAPIIANGQILDFKVFGRHGMFDIRKHVTGSLIDNCEAFKVEFCKKREDFDHNIMQTYFNDNVLIDFISKEQTGKKLFEYNMYDCIALALIFYRYKISIESIDFFNHNFNYYGRDLNPVDNSLIIREKNIKEFGSIEQSMTIGQFVNKVFNKHVENENIELSKFYENGKGKENKKLNARLLTYFKDLCKNRVAGRVQLFNGVQKIDGLLASPDVCSLYPYQMMVAPNVYPCGEIVEVEKYEDKPNGLIGYFYCDIDQSNMKVSIVPEKTIEGNNWDAKIVNNIFISSIMIEYLKLNGCKVEIRNGIYFDNVVKGCKLFKFLLNVMKLKNEEDKLKESKDPKYNQVMREIYKLVMNIPSGKLNQYLNTDKREIVNSHEFAEMLTSGKYESFNTLMVSNGKIHISYKADESDCIRTAKPVYIGALIYDYSKIFMHRHMYTKIDYKELIYTDTDSNKLRIDAFNEWVKYAKTIKVPHWEEVREYDNRYGTHTLYEENSKVFGSFENEYKDNNFMINYFLQKKTYLCIDPDYDKKMNKEFENERKKKKESKKYVSFHFKGVSDRDLILEDNNIIQLIAQNKKNKVDSNKMLSDYSNEESNKKLMIKNNYLKLFEKLYKDKTCVLLTFSFKRISNNTKKNVKLDEQDRMNKHLYNIATKYTPKVIKIKF